MSQPPPATACGPPAAVVRPGNGGSVWRRRSRTSTWVTPGGCRRRRSQWEPVTLVRARRAVLLALLVLVLAPLSLPRSGRRRRGYGRRRAGDGKCLGPRRQG